MADSFGARSTLAVGGKTYTIWKLAAIEKAFPAAARLPFSLKVLLENLLCAPKTACRSARRTSKRWRAGTRKPNPIARSALPRLACSCRTSRAYRPSSIWPPCATP